MTLSTALILIVISIAIGFLIGALVYGLRGRPPAPDRQTSPGQEVRLRRDPQTQALSIEVDGVTYQQVGELTPEARSRLAKLARDWQLWLGLPLSRLAALAAPSSAEQAAPLQPDQAVGAPQPIAQPPPGKAPAKPARDAGKAAAESPPQSIAAQIDEILQASLENTPLAGRGLKLQELPGQGLVVMVGTEKYTDLTLVPDREVREAIATAVAEWEKKNAP